MIIQNDQFQTNWGITDYDISTRIRLPENVPHVAMCVGVCRSGNTAQQLLFSQRGFLSLGNPIKGIVKALVNDGDTIFKMSERTPQYWKESIGAYTIAESQYNPIKLLLDSGFPKDKLDIIFLVRHPVTTLSSWMKHWSVNKREDWLFENFLSSYRSLGKSWKFAQENDLRYTTFDYEATRDSDQSIRSMSSLMRRLNCNLPETDSSVQWNRVASNRPSELFVPDVHSFPKSHPVGSSRHKTLEQSEGFKWIPTPREDLHKYVKPQYLDAMQLNGLLETYSSLSNESVTHLEIEPIEVDPEISAFMRNPFFDEIHRNPTQKERG